jgi:ribosome-associated protein
MGIFTHAAWITSRETPRHLQDPGKYAGPAVSRRIAGTTVDTVDSTQRNTPMIQVTDTIVLNDREVKERFVRATGARGQNVNKEATAVELRVDLERSSLPRDVKKRLMALAGRHVTTSGVLVIVSRALRSQLQNRDAAHARLITLLKRAAKPPKRRKGTRPAQAVVEERLISKHRQSAIKRSRSGRDDE